MPASSALQVSGKDKPVLNDETEVAVMKASARIAGVLSGAALGFGLIAGLAPLAHADGGHRHESGRSGFQRSDVDTSDWPQGKSLSDPDGGQWDKPGHDGGEDDDRDGNNGCGNDTDRSDDNNGDCGRQAAGTEVSGDTDDCVVEAEDDDADDAADCPGTDEGASAAGTVTPAPADTSVAAAAGPATAVPGATEVAPADTSTALGTKVLGITETAPSTLARTGAGVAALAGALCLGGGRLTALIRRRIGS